MKQIARTIIAAALALLPVIAQAQSPAILQSLPPNTVVGRLGIGPGAAQAIPNAAFLKSLQVPCSSSALGFVPATGGDPTKYLSADCTFKTAVPNIANNTLLANTSGSTGPAAATTPTGLWDAFCSTTIGNFWVRMSGGWGCTSLGYANPVWWGADPTGATDSASAFNTAIATKLPIRWPKGNFTINSRITWTLSNGVDTAAMTCAGNNLTKLNWPNANGGILVVYANLMNNTEFENCRLSTSQAGSGTAISIQGANTGSAPWSKFNNLMLVGNDFAGITGSNYWAIGIDLKNTGDIVIRDTNSYGPINVGGGIGIRLAGQASGPTIYTTLVNIFGGSYNFHNPGIQLGDFWQGVTIDTVNCNGGTTGTGCVQQVGGTTGSLALLLIKGCQMNVGGNQIDLNANVDNVTIVDNPGITCSTNNCTAVNLGPGGRFRQIANNLFFKTGTPTGTTGIYEAGGQLGIVSGNIFSGFSLGINLGATSNNYIVGMNLYPTTTTPTVNSGSANSIGNVAQGTAISVTK